MPIWFLVSLIPPLLYTTSNFLDKVLLDHLPGRAAGGIILFSSLFSVIVLPIIFFITGTHIFQTPGFLVGISLASGALTVLSIVCYLEALFGDEVSFVAPILQLTPVFGFIFGFFFLDETITLIQIFGGLIILFSSIILSVRRDRITKLLHIKKRTLLLMVLSATLFALAGTIFKFSAQIAGYWPIQFWEYVGILLLGLFVFLFHRGYRQSFLSFFQKKPGKKFALATVTELSFVGGDLVLNFATLLAPIALVYTVNAIQPFFIFIGSLLMHKYFRAYSKETVHKSALLQKGLAALGIVIGSIILYI